MCLNGVKDERNGMKYGLIMFGGLCFFVFSMLFMTSHSLVSSSTHHRALRSYGYLSVTTLIYSGLVKGFVPLNFRILVP